MRSYHSKGTRGAPDGAALGRGSGPTWPAAHELARALEKERGCGQSAEVHYRRIDTPDWGARSDQGGAAGRGGAGRAVPHTPQTRSDSDRVRRGGTALPARGPASIGTRSTGEQRTSDSGRATTRHRAGGPREPAHSPANGRRRPPRSGAGLATGPNLGPGTAGTTRSRFDSRSQSSQWGTAPTRGPGQPGVTGLSRHVY